MKLERGGVYILAYDYRCYDDATMNDLQKAAQREGVTLLLLKGQDAVHRLKIVSAEFPSTEMK